jgi:AcrR family transcriptional regulator
MPRPATITDKQILDAARTQFFEHGFGVSTATIAQKAGVSEGTIFKRFPTKVQLFQSAMGLPKLPFHELELLKAGHMDLREQLGEIAFELVSFLRALMPRMMMLWAQPNMNPVSLFKGNEDAPPKVVLRTLTAYFEAERQLGRIQCKDPEILARMFMGVAQNFVFFELITAAHRSDEEVGTFVEGMLDVLWDGIEA